MLTAVTTALALTVAACGNDSTDSDPARNFRLPITTTTLSLSKSPLRLTTPTLPTLTPPTTVEDLERAEQIADAVSASDGRPFASSATLARPLDCYDEVAQLFSDQKLPSGWVLLYDDYITQVATGIFDCDDPGEFLEEFLEWTTKLIQVQVPDPDPEAIPDRGVVSRETGEITWRIRVAPGFDATPDLGFIYAYDLAPDSTAPGGNSGTIWFYDRLEIATADCAAGEWSDWKAMGGNTVHQVSIPLDRYRPGSRELCARYEVRARGTGVDGEISDYYAQSGERFVILPDVDEDDLVDPFVMIGFGDSYGSGEGNPYRKNFATSLNGLPCLVSIAFTPSSVSRCDSELWWETGALEELGVNNTSLKNAGACHRSSESGLSKAAAELAQTFTGEIVYSHFACSGAVSDNIWKTTYRPGFFTDPTRVPVQITEALDWLVTVDRTPSEVDAVVVSIGGNDVGFSDVIYDCFIEAGDCYNESDTRALYSSILELIPEAIRAVVIGVRSNFPNAGVYFTLYTDGISVNPASDYDDNNDGVCSEEDDPWFTWVPYETDEMWDIKTRDSVFVKGFLQRLNQTIVDSVNEINNNGARGLSISPPDTNQVYIDGNRSHGIGVTRVISSQFTDHRNNGFCTRNRRNIVFNDEAIANQGGDIFGFWSSGGWHPNDLGQRFYAEGIVEAMSRDFQGDQYTNLAKLR